MEDYIKCELICGGSPRHINTLSNLYIVAVHYTHINTHYVLLLLLTAPILEDQLQLYSRTCNIAQENTTAEDILIENQLRPPLDMKIVDQE